MPTELDKPNQVQNKISPIEKKQSLYEALAYLVVESSSEELVSQSVIRQLMEPRTHHYIIYRYLAALLQSDPELFETEKKLHMLNERILELELQIQALRMNIEHSPQVSYVSFNDPYSTSRQSRYDALIQCEHLVEKTLDNFDDYEARLHYFIQLKDAVKELCEAIRPTEDKYSLEVAELLYDALAYSYAEQLERSQVEVVQSVLKILQQEGLKQHDAMTVDRMLLEVGLDSIPSGEEAP